MRCILGLALVATACGGKPSTPTTLPGNTASSTAPATGDPVRFEIDRTLWLLDVPGAVHAAPDAYTHRFTIGSFSIDVIEWPISEAFVQSIEEDLQGLRDRDPDAEVLHQQADGPDDWQTVARTATGINGGRKLSGPGINLMCTFELPADADWKPALDACRKVRPAEPEEADVDPGTSSGEGY